MPITEFNGQLDQGTVSGVREFTGQLDAAPVETAPAARRGTTFTGLTKEALKGAGRGVTGLVRALAGNLGPTAIGVPEKMQLPAQPELQQLRDKVYQAVAADPNASIPEQMVGTGAEIGTSMLPFMDGPAKLATKAVQLAVPVAGGIAGEQIGGDTGKLVGTMVAPLGQLALSRALPSTALPAQTAALNQTAKELHDANIALSPEQMGAGGVARSLQGFAGDPALNAALQSKNQLPLQRLAAQETNVNAKNMTAAALDNASKNVAATAYAPVRAIPDIAPRGQYMTDLRNIANEFKSIDQTPQIYKRLEGLNVNRLSGKDAVERIAQLRSDAGDAFNSDNRNYGKALRMMANALENQIERTLPAGSAVLKNYQAGRMQIAKNNSVKEMLVDPNTGVIDTTKAAKLLEDGAGLTGGLETIAKAGSKMFAASTRPPIKGEGLPINWGTLYSSAAGGAAGFASTGSSLGAAIGIVAPPLARAGAKHLAASNWMQNRMAAGLMPQPSMFGGAVPPPSNAFLGALPMMFGDGGQQ